MPAAVAVPLITSAVGAGTTLISQKMAQPKQPSGSAGSGGLAQKARNVMDGNTGAVGGEDIGGDGGGGSSYSSSGGSWSRGGTVIDPEIRNAAFGANQSFLESGGLSNEDLASMRARALSPVRAAYSNAQREVNRQRSLQGGYSPGFSALQARMAREQGQATSDAATNAEGQVVGMRQQGRIAGLQGMNSMYANMPTFSESESWNNSGGGSSGGGGGGELPTQMAEKGPGAWDYIKKGLEVGLPIGLSTWNNRKQPPLGGEVPGGGIPTYGGIPNPSNIPGYGTPIPPPVQLPTGIPNNIPGYGTPVPPPPTGGW